MAEELKPHKYQGETATGLDRHAEKCFIRRFLAMAAPDLRRNS